MMPVRVLLCIAAGLALAGCVTTRTTECPPDAAFSAESQNDLADELRAAAPKAEWAKYIVAYKRLRNACRAINGIK